MIVIVNIIMGKLHLPWQQDPENPVYGVKLGGLAIRAKQQRAYIQEQIIRLSPNS